MNVLTQTEAFFGGAFYITPAMGTIRLHPDLARVYMAEPDTELDLHVPFGSDIEQTGVLFYVFNEGSASIRIYNDIEEQVLGTIAPQRMGIVVRTTTSSVSIQVPGPPAYSVPPYRVHERVSY